jgi:P27 family predicted phage terminase small subunit
MDQRIIRDGREVKDMKQAGRKPKPQKEVTPAAGHPACPPHIKGEARAEWDRICGELDLLGLLTTADRPALALYCKAWARWIEAEAKVAELGLLVSAPKTKTPMGNPYLSIANKAHEQMLKLLVEYGLTPSARSRMRIAKASLEQGDEDLDF